MMKHYYQPNEFSCAQGSAAIFLSHFGFDKTPEDILAEVPVRSWPGKDEPAGTPNQDIAAYFCKLGFDVELISSDVWVTDLSWVGKDTNFIQGRLQAASGALTAPLIGRDGTELYIQAYLDFIKAGGKLKIVPAIASAMIRGYLETGPIIATVAYGTLHGCGKGINTGPTQEMNKQDDVRGTSPNHYIVVSNYIDGKFEYYDPWARPGIHMVEPDQLVAAIATAQQECDNMIIVARKKLT